MSIVKMYLKVHKCILDLNFLVQFTTIFFFNFFSYNICSRSIEYMLMAKRKCILTPKPNLSLQ